VFGTEHLLSYRKGALERRLSLGISIVSEEQPADAS
jgi:hypothetical protein